MNIQKFTLCALVALIGTIVLSQSAQAGKDNCVCNYQAQDCPDLDGHSYSCVTSDCTQTPNGCTGGRTCNGMCKKGKKIKKAEDDKTRGGEGSGGADVSVLELPNTVFGHSASVMVSHQADDFTINPGEFLNLTDGLVFMYEFGSAPGGSVTELYIQIWDQPPHDGGAPIAGDMVTNRLLGSEFSGTYRVMDGDLMDTSRAISAISFDMSWLGPLTEGDYWIEFAAHGAGDEPTLPVRSLTDPFEANSRSYDVATGTWQDNIDPASGMPSDIPFVLYELDPTP